MRGSVAFAAVFVVVAAAMFHATQGADVYTTTCTMVAAGDTDVSGTVTLTQLTPGGVVTLAGTISNIPDGMHGLHVHSFGDVSAVSGKGTGGHWNPANVSHGCYPNPVRHAGDIGNITFTGGSYTFPGGFTRDLLELTGETSVVGRALVLHADPDSCTGTSGNAGARLAQCVIGLKAPGGDTQAAHYVNSPATFNATWAVAKVAPLSGAANSVSGYVWFQALPGGRVRVHSKLSTDITGGSEHGMHVHAYGDISDPAGSNLGGHYNPAGVDHGWPGGPRHMGDMGNWSTDATSGAMVGHKNLDLLDLGGSINNIVGRAVVVHAGPDDGGQPTGNAGNKIAAGPIGLAQGAPAKLVAVIKGTVNAPGAGGTVYLEQPFGPGTPVTISGTLTGLPEGQHGFHIHEWGFPGENRANSDGTTAGGHYNPDNQAHGCYPNPNRHAGDIGSIVAAADGSYTFPSDFTRDLIDLTGPRSVVGRAIVIHAQVDDCMGTSGNAGPRLAVGVLGVASASSTEMNSAYQGIEAPESVYRAVAVMQSIESPTNANFAATFYFRQVGTAADPRLRIYGLVDGLTPQSVHGLHAHTYGDLSDVTGALVGGHYNPENTAHGLPTESPRHAGDFGNAIFINQNGRGYVNVEVPGTLVGVDSIVGRTLIIHSGSDKGAAEQPTGAAGSKIAAGVIGICAFDCWPDVLLLAPVDEGTKIDPISYVILAACVLLVCIVCVAAVVVWRKKRQTKDDNKLDFI